jgi:hypothetical protein
MIMKIGDLVKPADNAAPLLSPAGEGTTAVVVSLSPFVVVSPSGDTIWYDYYPGTMEVCGEAPVYDLLRVIERLGNEVVASHYSRRLPG